jgi:hypothetical protein
LKLENQPKQNDLSEDARRVYAYIRTHSFCEMDDILDALGKHVIPGSLDEWLFDVIHELEARCLIRVERSRPKFKLYATS